MASRGAIVAGTSGADFEHREQVAAQYQISVLNKYRLRCAIFFHCALFLLLLAKLSVAVLDRLDIFILELEELEIPQPQWWEWAWALSPLTALAALGAMRRNSAALLRRYLAALAALGAAPLLAALAAHAPDLYVYCSAEPGEELDIQMWQGVPVCVVWSAFVLAGAQVHAFQVLFARRLLAAWTGNISTAAAQRARKQH